MERAQEIIKDELASMIEEMQKAKKETPEWLLIEDALLTLLRATRFLVDKLDNIEKTVKQKC